mmetsp:Transcript_9638/g.17320  ORF Transcript_9638/g.17320 Transcript_9638/m.17320 type:complete len:324 (-) Transcript_9638:80-1051(-)
MHHQLKKPDGPKFNQSASTSRLPSVSRALSTFSTHPYAKEQSFAVEYVGGAQRWRLVETAPMPEEPRRARLSKPLSQPNLHAVTLAGGWGTKSKRDKRIAKTITHLGYCPGLPRRRAMNESRLGSFLPPEYKAGSFSDFKPTSTHQTSLANTSEVLVDTRANLRILELPPTGERLVVKRWAPGYFELPPKLRGSSTSTFPKGASSLLGKNGSSSLMNSDAQAWEEELAALDAELDATDTLARRDVLHDPTEDDASTPGAMQEHAVTFEGMLGSDGIDPSMEGQTDQDADVTVLPEAEEQAAAAKAPSQSAPPDFTEPAEPSST